MKPTARLTAALSRAPTWVVAAWAMAAAFSTYFCMYAFRKPFTAAGFDGLKLFGTTVDLKTALVISQIVGYTLSKYIGVKVCSETGRDRRGALLIGLVLVAQAALLLFAIVPPQLRIVAIFINGLPLGMVFGMVVGYLEGRRTSEVLLAGLSCSFILASGVVKDVGRWLMSTHGVTEAWMPAWTGLLFLPVFLLSVWLLEQLPPPSAADVADRSARVPMDAQSRRVFMRQFLPGLTLLIATYVMLTAYRDFRDSYGVEIFRELGYGDQPALFTATELPVAFGVLVACAAIGLVRSHVAGLVVTYVVMIGGLVLQLGATALFQAGHLGGVTWMVLVGLGAYLAYVPYNTVLFDRLIASTRTAGTAVFAIYVADALGYTGSVAVQLYKDLGESAASRLSFFVSFSYVTAGLGALMLAASLGWFLLQGRPAAGLARTVEDAVR